MADRRKRHFTLGGKADSERFRTPPRPVKGSAVPSQNRQRHGLNLLRQIEALRPQFEEAREIQLAAGLEDGFGLQIEFESFPDIELVFESLARESHGIELRNVRHQGEQTCATVFVPDGKIHIFERLISDYLDETKDTKTGPRNRKLLNAVSQVRAATLDALWTDSREALPESDKETFWWEVWLPVRGDREENSEKFRELVASLGFRLATGELRFPERTVILIFGSAGQMKQSILVLNSIAELRRAKETAEFFDALPPDEQREWLDDLIDRLRVPEPGSEVPHVCLLDTGLNHGHPLLAPVAVDEDMHSVEPEWGTNDTEGHGTAMAGLACFGDLVDALASQETIELEHRLESVKLLKDDGGNAGNALHHGYLTTEAVARPEITAPKRPRVFAMAVTTRDDRDRGRPSAWSAALDRLAADAEGQGEYPRLFLVSAGNVSADGWKDYPASNASDSIHDPGQSWNALTVGASTQLVHITEPDTDAYEPVAPAGGLSPFSTTSLTWQSHWPLKPDVVFEGGNAGVDELGVTALPSLSLLTTNSLPQERLFTTSNATSAATALAARMAAQLMAQYPLLWPESIRALLVHSADWTDAMRQAFLPQKGTPNKSDWVGLVRHCGFGVPNLDRAMWSVENSLTMVCEDQLFPFRKERGSEPVLRDMNLHRLPWPLEELEALEETPVEMRVTLSYFIEPNPSQRGIKSRYRYESHCLRFDVKRPTESEAAFRARINVAARDAEEGSNARSTDPNWLIGTKNRHKGSLHADIWYGPAAELASRGAIAIYPAAGWWKTRKKLERFDQQARYSLVVSIRAPEQNVDLYSAVENQIETVVEVEV